MYVHMHTNMYMYTREVSRGGKEAYDATESCVSLRIKPNKYRAVLRKEPYRNRASYESLYVQPGRALAFFISIYIYIYQCIYTYIRM